MNEARPAAGSSYWIGSTPGPDHPVLQGEVEVDVAVIGSGIVGLTSAWLLKQEGKRVAVIEMDRIAAGVTGYTTAKITAGHNLIYSELESKHDPETAAAYARTNQSAIEQIAALIDAAGIDCDFSRRSNYVYCESPDEADAIKQEYDSAKRAGLDVTYLTTSISPIRLRPRSGSTVKHSSIHVSTFWLWRRGLSGTGASSTSALEP